MADPDVIDPQAHARLQEWGGPKLLVQMIRLFLENAPTRVDQVRRGLAEGAIGEVERGVHSLKSSAANVGATVLSRTAAAMEDLANAGDTAALAGLMPTLDAAWDRAREQLSAILDGRTDA